MSPKQPKGLLSLSIAAALSLSGFAFSTTPVQADAFTDALTGGKVKMDVRLRYEDVEDDSAAKDAELTTIRTRLGYQTGNFMDFDAYVEMENVTTLGDDDEAKTAGVDGWESGNAAYSAIVDPEGTELNRYWLGYNGLPDTVIRLGRQRIKLDNDRFIGNVGWRQNEQTYDSVTLTNKSIKDVTAFYSYISEAHGIKHQDTEMETHLVNLSYSGLGFGKITAYGYFIEFEKDSKYAGSGSVGSVANDQSQETLGLRFNGSTDVGNGVKVLYTAEYAQQEDYKGGNSYIDYDYALINAGASFMGVTVRIGYEELEGDSEGAFQTPLATLHGQNGWTDMFLNTPEGGLEDTSIAISTKLFGVKLKAVYHEYESESGSTDYGDEWNLVAVKKFGKHYHVMAKYAQFDVDNDWTARNGKEDKDKFWLQAGFKF